MSREAYLAAVAQGADGFECDLRLTKDRVLVCWHDSDMKRVANRNLVIAKSTFSELRATYPIITLEELLEIALENRKSLALETKHPVTTGGAVERELVNVLNQNRSRIAAAGIQVSIMSFSWLANGVVAAALRSNLTGRPHGDGALSAVIDGWSPSRSHTGRANRRCGVYIRNGLAGARVATTGVGDPLLQFLPQFAVEFAGRDLRSVSERSGTEQSPRGRCDRSLQLFPVGHHALCNLLSGGVEFLCHIRAQF